VLRPRVVLNYIGKIIVIIGLAMLSSFFCSFYYGESIVWRLLIAATVTIVFGLLLTFVYRHDENLNYREGFAVVTLGWIAAAFFSTLPFLFSGYFPSFADALFEAVSGITTTGATILTDIEALPRSLLFWRSLTQWLGGMGIMVLFIAIIAGMGVRANQIFRAELPGGTVSSKVSPRIKETARILWITYVVLSIILLVLLYAFGMDLFDAFCHTFSTMATGGFSTKNQSIGFYDSPLIQWTIIAFMFIAGANFSLHYLSFKNRSLKTYLKNQEFVLYSVIVIMAFIVVFADLSHFPGVEERIRTGLFQVVSIITTTGYGTADYTKWTSMGQGVILVLMFIGACAGSTSGNIKVGRYLIMLQRSLIEFKQMIHPKALIPLRYGDKVLSESLVINVLQYFFLHMSMVLIGTVILDVLGLDILSAFTAVVSCMGNVGPAFGALGPADNYAFITDLGKYWLCFLMLLGRLEIFPFLVMLLPEYWKD